MSLIPTSAQPFRDDEDIVATGRGLADLSLPKRDWTHAAHFAAAMWLLRRGGPEDPSTEMRRLIRTYNEATGVANTDQSGYHETITRASLRAARGFLRSHPQLSLCEACNALLATPLGRSQWLLEYWSKPVLFSVAARRGWVDPDIKALPF
jgi:hypothetical protein